MLGFAWGSLDLLTQLTVASRGRIAQILAMRYRRARLAGASYFFTVVTWRRRPILCRPDLRAALRRSLDRERHAHPFTLDAIVVLPDHLHCIWTLPPEDSDFPGRWRRIKANVSRLVAPEIEAAPTTSRQAKGERGVWQRRYWEHVIRDEADYEAHVDYIHFNPVRHGLVERPADWPWSSLHRWVREGRYPPTWGATPVHLPQDVGRE
jgi:putative transposase